MSMLDLGGGMASTIMGGLYQNHHIAHFGNLRQGRVGDGPSHYSKVPKQMNVNERACWVDNLGMT